MNNADKFKQIFDLCATELWAMPEKDFLAWLNAERDVPDTNIGELISRQAALDIINAELSGWLTEDERLHLEGVGTGIECLPTADSVKHGEWIFENRNWFHQPLLKCSCCGRRQFFARFDYCPYCGTKMKRGEG